MRSSRSRRRRSSTSCRRPSGCSSRPSRCLRVLLLQEGQAPRRRAVHGEGLLPRAQGVRRRLCDAAPRRRGAGEDEAADEALKLVKAGLRSLQHSAEERRRCTPLPTRTRRTSPSRTTTSPPRSRARTADVRRWRRGLELAARLPPNHRWHKVMGTTLRRLRDINLSISFVELDPPVGAGALAAEHLRRRAGGALRHKGRRLAPGAPRQPEEGREGSG